MRKSARGVVVGVALLAIAFVLGVVIHLRGRGASTSTAVGARPSGARAATASEPRSSARTARGSIAGTVRDERGAPIPNARVCAHGVAVDISPSLLAKTSCANTDAAGRYAIRDLVAAGYETSAGAPTYRPAYFHASPPREDDLLPLAAGQARDHVDFVLAAGGVQLTGTVYDAGGGPIAHARVSADVAPLVETDDRGAFAVWVGPGGVIVIADADDYRSERVIGSAPGAMRIELQPASTITGTVVDGATGAPIEDAYVTLKDGDAHDFSGPDGSFRLEGLWPGRDVVMVSTAHGAGQSEPVTVAEGGRVEGVLVRLHPAVSVSGRVLLPGTPARDCPDAEMWITGPPIGADEEGHGVKAIRFGDRLEVHDVAPATYEVEVTCPGWIPPPPETIVVANHDVSDRTWTVTAGASIEGRLTTRSGAPVQNADVEADSEDSHFFHSTTDANGHFEVHGLPPGNYEIEPHIDGSFGSHTSDFFPVGAGATVHRDLVVDDLGSVHIVFVDTRGAAIPRVEVRLMREDMKGDERGFDIDGTANEGGELLFTRVFTGTYRVDDEHKVKVEAGKTAEVKVVKPAKTATLRGIVLRPDGTPSPDAQVRADGRRDGNGADTALDGTFKIDALPDDSAFEVSATDKSGRVAKVKDVPTGSTITIKLLDPAAVDGVIANAPPNTKLELFRDGGWRQDSTVLPKDGAFTYDNLDPGEYTIKATAKTGVLAANVTLAGGAHEHLKLEFSPYQTLTARVVDAVTKAPVAGIEVTMEQSHGQHSEQTDASGRATFTQAEPGTATFTALDLDRPSSVIAAYGVATITTATSELTVLAYHADFASWSDPGFMFFKDWGYCRYNAFITTVDPKGAAAAAGLRTEDRVVAINGHRLDNKECILAPAIMHPPPGTWIELELQTGAKLRFKAVAAPPPENGRVFTGGEG